MRSVFFALVALACSMANASDGLYPNSEIAGQYDLDGGCLYFDLGADADTYLCRTGADEVTLYAGSTAILVCNAAGCTMAGDLAMGANSITGMADPTSDQDAATKTYVDERTAALDLFYMSDTASGDIGGYKQVSRDYPSALANVTTTGDSDEKLIQAWATEPGVPGVSAFAPGDFVVHAFGKVATHGGTDCEYKLRVRMYMRDSIGSETQVDGDQDTETLTTSSVEHTLFFHVSAQIVDPTDRGVIKLYAVRTCGAPRTQDVDVTVYYGDSTQLALVAMPSTFGVLDNYLPVAGGTMTGDITFEGNVGYDGPTEHTPSGNPCNLTIDWSTGTAQHIDLDGCGADLTLTFSNPATSGSYALIVTQGATARNITWPATVVWQDALGVPTISVTNNDFDLITCFYSATKTKYLCDYGQDYH